MTKVALVVLDTLREDTFDSHFDWLDGRRFENAWSTSHWTVPAHASLFTGEYASDAGCYARSPDLDYEGKVLAERLSGAGYATRAFSSNRHVTPYFGFDRGFDEFTCVDAAKSHDDDVFSPSEYFGGPAYRRPGQALRALTDAARGKFDVPATLGLAYEKLSRRHPFVPALRPIAGQALAYARTTDFEADDSFVFLNLMDVHAPYKPPLRYQSRRYSRDDLQADTLATYTGREVDGSATRSAYEDCARYLSDVLREILDALADFEYVIVVSDHGESFGEQEVWAHPSGLHPELTRVPLVVRGPDVEPGTVETPVNLLDVFATVADVAGLDVDTPGQSLRGEVAPRPCLTEFHGIMYERIIERIRERGVTDREIAAFDEPRSGVALAPDYYGYESVDGFTETGETDRESPRELLRSLKDDRRDVRREGVQLEDDVESRLRRLGYL